MGYGGTPPFEIKTPTIVIQPGIKPDVNGQKPIPMGPPIVIPSHTYYFNTKSIAQNGRFSMDLLHNGENS